MMLGNCFEAQEIIFVCFTQVLQTSGRRATEHESDFKFVKLIEIFSCDQIMEIYSRKNPEEKIV